MEAVLPWLLRGSQPVKEMEEYLLTMFLQFEPNTQSQNAEN